MAASESELKFMRKCIGAIGQIEGINIFKCFSIFGLAIFCIGFLMGEFMSDSDYVDHLLSSILDRLS